MTVQTLRQADKCLGGREYAGGLKCILLKFWNFEHDVEI